MRIYEFLCGKLGRGIRKVVHPWLREPRPCMMRHGLAVRPRRMKRGPGSAGSGCRPPRTSAAAAKNEPQRSAVQAARLPVRAPVARRLRRIPGGRLALCGRGHFSNPGPATRVAAHGRRMTDRQPGPPGGAAWGESGGGRRRCDGSGLRAARRRTAGAEAPRGGFRPRVRHAVRPGARRGLVQNLAIYKASHAVRGPSGLKWQR